MRIGPYTVFPIETGNFALDGGAMFGVVPKNLWSKTNPADEQNRIDMTMRCLLLVHDNGRKILIDNGSGHKYNEKFAAIYRLDHSELTLEKSLKAFGFKPEDVTDMVLTHLHFDHAGGSTKLDATGNSIPAFPNAKYYVQRKQFEWSQNASEKDRASYLKPDYMPLIDQGILELVDDADKLFPNIRFFIASGHSPSQQLPIISDGQSTLFFCGDLIPMTPHVAIPYVMAYDIQPLVTIEEKKKILEQAIVEKWFLFFEHDPKTACATIRKDPKGFTIDQVIHF